MTNYAFVLDANGKQLAPTKETKAWFLIRKKRATLVSKYPMVIQLNREIPDDEVCADEIRCGIDDGGKYVGIALVQKGQTKNKVLFKGTIEQRDDVKHLMDARRNYRRYHRRHKRHRASRFNNRASSKQKNRVAPTILQKRQATIRVINQLRKWINITSYWLEDVSIDTRAMIDGYKPYAWQYQKSNRLDENFRKAVILRDGYKCMECGKSNCRLEVHHIRPKRLGGSNVLANTITLCDKCHQKTEGREEQFMQHFLNILGSVDNKTIKYAEHVMAGKVWLREQLSSLGTLHLTTGGDTANRRIDWDIEKTHSNDAVCITDLQPDSCKIKDWIIKPMRRQSKAKTDNVLGIRHRDIIKYSARTGTQDIGYVTSLYPNSNQLSFTNKNNKEYKKVSAKSCKILWRSSKICWLEAA